MKRLLSFLFFLATAHLLEGKHLNNRSRFVRSNSAESSERRDAASDGSEKQDGRQHNLFPCLTEVQQSALDECFALTEKMKDRSYLSSMSDCIDATTTTEKGFTVKKTCEAQYNRQIFIFYAECLFTRMGKISSTNSTSIATDPVDLESFKAATIEASDLERTKKSSALTDFDACMAANYSLPFSLINFNSDKIPDVVRNFTHALNIKFSLGRLAPTPAMRAVDCMESVLLQNDCATTSEETVATYMEALDLPKQIYIDNKFMLCLDEDDHWFREICNGLAVGHLALKWTHNCTKGHNHTEDTINDSCRFKRMAQFVEFVEDCMMEKHKAYSQSFFFKPFNKKDPELYKKKVIGGANVSDEQKVAAMEFFDACMAKNVTIPYVPIPHEDEVDLGPVYKDIIALINRMFRMGDLPPTEQIRVVDCTASALILNGCDENTPIEVIAKVYEIIIGVDKGFEILNVF